MSVVKTYIARPGSPLTNKDANRVGQFLDEKFGEEVFTAEQVVEAARPKDSPIHNDFTWTNSEAATLWRLHEARRLIGAVMLVEEVKAEMVTSRAYHHVIQRHFPERKSGYTAERVVWQNEEFSEQVIERAKRELTAWRLRYEAYEGLHEWAIEQLTSVPTVVAESV